MKHICCLIDSLGSGGAQRQLVGLAIFLKEMGYKVEVVFYHKYLFYEKELLKNDVPYVYLEKAERNMKLLPQIIKYFRRTNPDVVISYLSLPSICACIARLFSHRYKLIVSERSTTQVTDVYTRMKFNVFRNADYVVPNAFAQESYIKQHFPFLSPKVVTVPNFVDLEFFSVLDERKRNDIPEIVVAASIWPPKNTLGLIDAVAVLKHRGYKFHISWYGLLKNKMEYNNECKKKIEVLGVYDCFEMKKKTNQIREVYRNADIFCLPSFFEGTPNVICEAMACGLPIVCSDVCDNSMYVIEGENGFLFNPQDTESMVLAFERMFALGPNEYLSFSKRSRQIAELKLSKERFVRDYIKLIEN